VDVSIYDSSAGGPAQAQQAINDLVQADDKQTTVSGTRTISTGKRSVTGLGDQAIVMLQTITNANNVTTNWAALFVWSGNAAIQILYNGPMPGAVQVPGAIAFARDVLAALPRA
jgi:hypothetical protein